MSTQIGSIEVLPEHGGHEIHRRVVEEFAPVCRKCGWTLEVGYVWYRHIDDAMLTLRHHLRNVHNVSS